MTVGATNETERGDIEGEVEGESAGESAKETEWIGVEGGERGGITNNFGAFSFVSDEEDEEED